MFGDGTRAGDEDVDGGRGCCCGVLSRYNLNVLESRSARILNGRLRGEVAVEVDAAAGVVGFCTVVVEAAAGVCGGIIMSVMTTSPLASIDLELEASMVVVAAAATTGLDEIDG